MTSIEKVKTRVERLRDHALRGLSASNGAADYFNGRYLATEEILDIIKEIMKEDGNKEE